MTRRPNLFRDDPAIRVNEPFTAMVFAVGLRPHVLAITTEVDARCDVRVVRSAINVQSGVSRRAADVHATGLNRIFEILPQEAT